MFENIFVRFHLFAFFSALPCSSRKVIWMANGRKKIIYYFSNKKDDQKKVGITESKANKIRCTKVFLVLREK